MIKAKAEITISKIIDIEKTVRYYLLQSSTSSVPSKPASNPPGGNWITTEPSYTTGSTNTLYFVDLTIMSDGSFSYSAVSKSSSYEAAKAAYNKAVSAESSANTANSKIDNLKVGGRNLYRGTKDFSGNWVNKNGWTEDGTYDGLTVRKKSSPWGVLCQKIDAIQSEVYTCSLYIKIDVLNNFQMLPNLGGTGVKYNILSKDTSVTEINTWKRIWMTIEVTEDGVMQFGVEPKNIGGNVWICGLKLEKGTIATDWTPAPEDLETRVTNAETQITSNKEAIDLRATKTEVTTAKNDAIAAAEKYSDAQLVMKANAITSTVTELSKDYNGYKQSSTTAIQNAQGWQLNWDKILNGKEANTNKHMDYITFKDGNIKLGDSESTKTLEISSDDIQIRNGEDPVASFGESVLLGKPDNTHMIISKSGLKAYGNATSNPIEEITWGLFTDGTGKLSLGAHYGFGNLLDNPLHGFGLYSLVEGDQCEAGGFASHAEGGNTIVNGVYSHAEGIGTVVDGCYSHAEGDRCKVTLADDGTDIFGAHAEGSQTTASNNQAHAEGLHTIASGVSSHAEGNNTMATEECSHAEGCNTAASGKFSHATNFGSVASGVGSTAINGGNASGNYSLAAFTNSQAKHTYAAAIGEGAVTGKNNQTVIGYYNDPNLNTSALLVVGAGQNANNRRNVYAVGMDGSVWSAAGTYNGVDIGNHVYREGRGSQFNTSTPLLINGNSLNLATAQLILEYNNSYIRFRNDGGAVYIMNGDGNGWTNYITFFKDGQLQIPSTLKVPTCLYVPYATKASTTSAANAYISADGNGVLAKTSKTSSRRFKDSITPELDEDLNPERLYDVDVIQFKYKKDYFTNEDDIRYRKNMIGLIAEDVYDKYKIAADWHVDEDSGEVLVDGWNEQYIIPALLKLIQNQHKELQEQRKEIDQLKETVGILMKDYKERQSK